MIKKIIDTNRLQEYMKPSVKVVELQHKCQILAGSLDANGMNRKLQDEEVNEGW